MGKEEKNKKKEEEQKKETTGLDTMIAGFMKWGCWKFHWMDNETFWEVDGNKGNGNKNVCVNYRRIKSLFGVPGKLYNSIIIGKC